MCMTAPINRRFNISGPTRNVVAQEDLAQVFNAAISGGINYFDTAEVRD